MTDAYNTKIVLGSCRKLQRELLHGVSLVQQLTMAVTAGNMEQIKATTDLLEDWAVNTAEEAED